MCHVTLDYSISEAEARGGTHPCMGPCLQEWALTHAGSKSLVCPWVHEFREQVQEPRISKCQKPRGRERSHQALKSHTKSPRMKRATSLYVFQRSISLPLSIFGYSSAPSTSYVFVLGLAGGVFPAPSALLPSSPGRQTLWLTSLQTSPDLMGISLLTFSLP